MSGDIFIDVDRYIDGLFIPDDPVLARILVRARGAGMPDIHITAVQGRYLYLLAKLCAPRRILEVGTLAGYSTVWLARALVPDGRLITIECDAAYAEFARETLTDAGLDSSCEVINGRATEVMASLDEPFDLIFLDADKSEYPAYLKEATRLLRPGGLLLADNVVRGGAVLRPDDNDAMAKGAAEFNTLLAAHPGFEAIIQQQVGAKGHDGLAIARRTDK